MKTHHFKAIYYCEVGVIEQQFIRDWFVDHKVTKYSGRRFTKDMIILDDELIYNLVRKMNRLRNRIEKNTRVDYVLAKYEPCYCCKRTGTIV